MIERSELKEGEVLALVSVCFVSFLFFVDRFLLLKREKIVVFTSSETNQKNSTLFPT